MDNTITQQGSFTSDGNAKYIVLRSGVDWMRVVNLTQSAAINNGYGFQYFWQRGMDAGLGIIYYHPAADHTVAVDQIAAGNGFTLFDSSNTDALPAVDITASTNAVQPVMNTADTTGMADGVIVRLSNVTAALTLGGWDFEIDTIVANTSFRMRYAMQRAPGAAGTAGSYRIIPFNPIFYPRFRYIVNITQVAAAVITTSVQHGYKKGQKIRVNLPDAKFGMTQINGVEGIVTATTASTITTDIDSTAFNAFTFPLATVAASIPCTMPTVVPVGIDTGTALTGAVDILSDATRDTSYLGMKLAGGTTSPAGNNTDVIYWAAGKSFYNLAE